MERGVHVAAEPVGTSLPPKRGRPRGTLRRHPWRL